MKYFLLCFLSAFYHVALSQSLQPGFTSEIRADTRWGDFSNDGRLLVTGDRSGGKIWDVRSGRVIRELTGSSEGVQMAKFSANRLLVATQGIEDHKIRIWNGLTGEILFIIPIPGDGQAGDFSFTSDSKSLVVSFIGYKSYGPKENETFEMAMVIDVASGKITGRIDLALPSTGLITPYSAKAISQLSPVTNLLAVCADTSGSAIRVYNIKSASMVKTLTLPSEDGFHLQKLYVSPSGDTITEFLASRRSYKTQAISFSSGKVLYSRKFQAEHAQYAGLNYNQQFLFLQTSDSLFIRSVAKGQTITAIENANAPAYDYFSFFLSNYDNQFLLFDQNGMSFMKFNSAIGKIIGGNYSRYGNTGNGNIRPAFTDIGSIAVTNGDETFDVGRNGVTRIDTAETVEYYQHKRKQRLTVKPTLDENGIYRSVDLTFVDNRKLKKKYKINLGQKSAQFSGADVNEEGRFVATSVTKNLNFTLWDANGKELIKWMKIDSVNWVAMHPSGLFDASAGAMQRMYFVQGYDIIDFSQLKERYYEPGLVSRILQGEPMREVSNMKGIELPPDVHADEIDSEGNLRLELVNRGGGIGEVSVYINGKEIIRDARGSSDANAPALSLKIAVAKNKAILKGSENFIAVKAWNTNHWVVGRSNVVSYTTTGKDADYKPVLHLISIGIADYTGTELDLKYAGKDAEDISSALQLGARGLFGTDKCVVYNLTSPGKIIPTKKNIIASFDKIAATANPLDVMVVYLSGHGINYGGADGDWYYLTQDAYTASATAYADPGIRGNTTLSSEELIELFKKVPALKQVMIIDACASGKLVESLIVKKDIPSSTIKALDRMRDRTGLHIITGCAADAVSYEASKYGQGVLTYSLLEGLRGAALREEHFIDVTTLFQYAQDRVPVLAEGIGGIQRPQTFSPDGGQSFDVGQLTDSDKKAIPISSIRPVYIRSAFMDDDQLEDALQLGKAIDESLNEAASKGLASTIIFIDVREYPEGCKLSGRYQKKNGLISLKLKRKCEGVEQTSDLSGTSIEEIKRKILEFIR